MGTTLFASVALACSTGKDDAASATNNVTSIPQTAVTNQGQTGNCWLYATTAWVESLHDQANGNSIHYSPAYLLYWRLYDELTAGSEQATFGGYWGWAASIIRRYGLMPMGAFAVDDAGISLSAVDAINAQLLAGSLALAPTGTRDGQAVRAMLDDAFQLGNDTRALLTTVFGENGAQNFTNTALPTGVIQRPSDITVRSVVNGTVGLTTLDQLLGSQSTAPDATPDTRVGVNAWAPIFPPPTPGLISHLGPSALPGLPVPLDFSTPQTDDTADAGVADPNANPVAGLPPLTPPDRVAWRTYFQRIQRALNDGFPLPLTFSVNNDDIDQQGRFVAAKSIVSQSRYDGHIVLISDYEVTNVPGYGTLAVGTPANAAQKQASLDDNASISFFRVKNSWGNAYYSNLAGYDDIDTAYLEQPMDVCVDATTPSASTCRALASQVWDILLPPGY